MVPIVLLYRWKRFLISTVRKSICNTMTGFSTNIYFSFHILSSALLLILLFKSLCKSNLLVPIEDDEYNSKVRSIFCTGESQCHSTRLAKLAIIPACLPKGQRGTNSFTSNKLHYLSCLIIICRKIRIIIIQKLSLQ